MKKFKLIAFTLVLIIASSCSTQTKETEENQSQEENSISNSENSKIVGFTSIEKLAASVVESLQNKDYAGYYTHVMDKELELSQASRIKDSTIQKEFLHEFGFSLHEEKEYFNNLIHYYDSKNIDLNKVALDELEYTEYKGGEYHPLEMYEVFIPIKTEYGSLIDLTIIKVEDKYYLTSELGI